MSAADPPEPVSASDRGTAGPDPSWVRRTGHLLRPDPDRVLARPFLPGQELDSSGESRSAAVLQRVLELDDHEVDRELQVLVARFAHRHHDLPAIWDEHFTLVRDRLPDAGPLPEHRRRLVGACFTQEYAIEAAALFNPSMVPHPDQDGLPAGSTRFVMTLRGTGEGHVSSMELRTGTVDLAGVVRLSPPPVHARPPSKVEQIARRSWRLEFPPGSPFDERVLPPQGPAERHGIEDVRMVRFRDDDGTATYLGTYTAFDGRAITGQLLRTPDFTHITSGPLSGPGAQNKGLALFPRKIAGRYVAVSRPDRENNAITTSDDLLRWDHPAVVQRPEHAWELVQLGNCGPPIETEAGWLVLTHGVGPMRTYGIGALLLDLDDPMRVVGRLSRPLLTAQGDERSGYVPNVVYSCGAMQHGHCLVLPYGCSDSTTRLALVDLPALLEKLAGP
ncbi:glycoside hydrolase family 130 protein [Cellulomonas olei]|uniref:glycoside hydrolase family 130 protein n=1 Tax=Cellulomonas sp. P4 TaxID=3142533 RepID=UPI0031B9D5B1